MVNKATRMKVLTLLEPAAAVSVFGAAAVVVLVLVAAAGAVEVVLVSVLVVPKILLALLSYSLASRKPGRAEIRVGSSSVLLRRRSVDDSESEEFEAVAKSCLSHAFSRTDEATDGIADDCFMADRV